MKTRLMGASVLGVILLVLLVVIGKTTLSAQDEKKPESEPFGGLLEALKASPGCLGVETAQTGSGKLVIFAWFEDKKAALKWYYNDAHLEVVKKFFPGIQAVKRKPLKDIPDNGGPLMAIASLTLKGKPTKENPLPFSQIAIELYQPLPGGLAIGGKFTPPKVKVPRPTTAEKKP